MNVKPRSISHRSPTGFARSRRRCGRSATRSPCFRRWPRRWRRSARGVKYMSDEVHLMRTGVDDLRVEDSSMRGSVEPMVEHLDIVAARVEALGPRLEDMSLRDPPAPGVRPASWAGAAPRTATGRTTEIRPRRPRTCRRKPGRPRRPFSNQVLRCSDVPWVKLSGLMRWPACSCSRSSPTASAAHPNASSRSPSSRSLGEHRRCPDARVAVGSARVGPRVRSPRRALTAGGWSPRHWCRPRSGRDGPSRGRSRTPKRSHRGRRAGAPCPRRSPGRGTRASPPGNRTDPPPSCSRSRRC